jgi:hypothetical protein
MLTLLLDNAAATLIENRPVLTRPDCQEALDLARFWLNECDSNHLYCKGKSPTALPTRLLDVGVDTPTLYLYVTEEKQTRQGRYACLSYCWGSGSTCTTTKATLDQRKAGIPMKLLPQTMLDAVNLTRALGVRFLWIDALCILQGQSEHDLLDWERESANMAKIYNNAFVTICAAGSSNSGGGIFTGRSPHLFTTCRIPISSRREEGEIFVTSHEELCYLSNERINQRAWTLQERLLSPRVLSYGTDEISWLCKTSNVRESALQPTPSLLLGIYRLFYEPDAKFWRIVVEDYTCRDLTNPMDKLPALSGLASFCYTEISSRGVKDSYLAGMWKSDLLQSLQWEARSRFPLRKAKPSARCASYRAPSWSWASIEGSVAFPSYREDGGTQNRWARIIACEVETRGCNKFGHVSSGALTIRGALKKAPRVELDVESPETPLLRRPPHSSEETSEVRIGTILPDMRFSDNVLQEVIDPWCLLIEGGECSKGLLLCHINEKDSIYRRVGTFNIENDMNWWDGAPIETVVII